MGGSVGVQSTLGVVSTFWVELPLATARQAPAQPVVSGETLAGVRVLIAEDNPVNMITAVTLLQDWDMEVSEAPDGRAAVDAVDAVDAAAARGAPFDGVLMDVQMPRLDGFAAARELRQRYDALRLPIVALTAGALAAERDAALACGMNVFLTKPINEHAIKEALVAVVSRRESNATREAAHPRARHAADQSQQ